MQGDFEDGYHHSLHFFQTRQYKEAITGFRQALDMKPDSAVVHHYLGRSFLCGGMPAEAIQEFKEAIRIDPRNGRSMYCLAVTLMKNDRFDEAQPFLYEAIRSEPGGLPHVSGEVLELFQKKHSFSETEELLKKSIGILDRHVNSGTTGRDITFARAHMYSTLGQLYLDWGLLNEAMVQYREAIRIYPDNALFHGKLAGIYMMTNLLKEAVYEYHASLRYNPDDAAIHKELADGLVKSGEFIDAFNEYREAVRLDPLNQNYANVYRRFREILISMDGGGNADDAAMQSQLPSHGVLSPSPDDPFPAILAGGESERVEFKSSALWSKSYSKEDISASDSREVHKYGRDASRIIIAKTIAGFLNTEGGDLVIGIQEHKDGKANEITGIETDYPKLKDPCTDGYRRMIIDEIIRKYLPSEIFHQLTRYIRIHFPRYHDKTLCWLEIQKAEEGIFLKIQDEEHFFIRVDAETRQISDRALVDYHRRHFP